LSRRTRRARGRTWGKRIAAGLVALGLLAGCGGGPSGGAGKGAGKGAGSGPVKLLETGSTLLYPLFNLWVPAYQKAHPGVQITTQGTGSGTGIAEAVKGVAQIGASDAYMADQQMKQYPDMLNIPLAISVQQVNYNLPGLNATHLKLSGPVLAGIYSGAVRYWDDPALAKLNPGVSLPHRAIIAVHRSDGSGDTFIFTQYLSFSDPAWQKAVGYGTTVSWPAVASAVGASGNPGVVQALQQHPYTIGYVGISWIDQTNKAGLGYAALRNRDGRFVLPTAETAKAAAQAKVAGTPPDERISLVFAPGADSYPIINYEYAVVSARQPDARVAGAIRDFLTWAVSPDGGNSAQFLDRVHFLPLPASVAKLSAAQIAKIGA
jgi:phosphate transport system substrate-binding protein